MKETKFTADNRAYEAWLRTQCAVVEKDLALKHQRMRQDPFRFLRATYFRWARRIEAICPELTDAPAVLAVGDAHLENFGTWRDAEGRLIWGINDFDEAAVMPYPFDLVRLAASARLAPELRIANRAIAEAILLGYRRGLKAPRATLLDEHERWMRPLVACSDKERTRFWKETDNLLSTRPPRTVMRDLRHSLPAGASLVRFCPRVRGSGSLGRPRYVAIATCGGGRVVREAKALVPSAWDWAHDRAAGRSRFLALARGRFRSPDPHLQVRHGFIIRRIAPDARKVEFTDDAGARVKIDLLEAMGFDLGAIHAAGGQAAAAVLADLRSRPAGWLAGAAKAAAQAVKADFRAWRLRHAGKDLMGSE
ncbi:MAG TPA: DUF2252 family protein [Methylomirabilota bacterium]|nr:DUF2252 family protein [Methylomirabilota bacterium]